MHKNTLCCLEHGGTTIGDQCKVDFAMDFYCMESAGNVPAYRLPPEPEFVKV
jgi:hypothetical protein